MTTTIVLSETTNLASLPLLLPLPLHLPFPLTSHIVIFSGLTPCVNISLKARDKPTAPPPAMQIEGDNDIGKTDDGVKGGEGGRIREIRRKEVREVKV